MAMCVTLERAKVVIDYVSFVVNEGTPWIDVRISMVSLIGLPKVLSCPMSLKQQQLHLLLMDLLLLWLFLKMLFRSLRRSMIGCFTLNQVLLPPMPSNQVLGHLLPSLVILG